MGLKRLINISPDFFRLLLALLVMVYHSVDFLTIGHFAVYVFFILSGYWISKMFREKYVKYDKVYWVYIFSRLSRVYPIYWLIFLFTIAIYFTFPQLRVVALNSSSDNLPLSFLNNFVVLTNNFDRTYWFIGSAWSLGVELQFYLIAPLILFALNSKSQAAILLLISSVIAIAGIYYSWSIAKVDCIFTYLPYFILGGIIYVMDVKPSYNQARNSLLAVIGILLINYSIPDLRNNFLLSRTAEFAGFNYREGLNVILTLLFIPYIAFNVKQVVVKSETDAIMSSMSYVIYLLHWPLLQIYALTVQNVGFLRKSLHLLTYYVICTTLCFLISKYIDQAFEKKRRGWLKQRRKKVVAD